MSAKKNEKLTDRSCSEEETSRPMAKNAPKYFVNHHAGGWHAKGRKIFGGHIFFDSSSNSYDAISLFSKDRLAKAVQGFRNAEHSPVGDDGEFKSEFLLVASMRLFSQIKVLAASNPALKQQNILMQFRRRAILASINERELKSGESISEKAWANANAMIHSEEKFREWTESRLLKIWEMESAAEILSTHARWIRAIDRALSEPPDPDEARFLRAVEIAAAECGGVPTCGSVKTEFNRNRSQNQIGAGSTFKTILNRLLFSWLPPSPPGRPSRLRNRPRKSAT